MNASPLNPELHKVAGHLSPLGQLELADKLESWIAELRASSREIRQRAAPGRDPLTVGPRADLN